MTNYAATSDTDSGLWYEREWSESPVVYFTVDYECDYGTALAENTYDGLEETSWLVSLLESLGIPLTCFVQTEILEEKAVEVERLRNADTSVSFHPHSHTHRPREETDIPEELSMATRAYEAFFGRPPTGYRFPNGNVRSTDYEILAKYGYEFDASVFPSWRLGHFDNMDAPTQPEYMPTFDLFEIPFTVYSDRIRVPTALCYCRLLGRSYVELLLRSPPPVIIFNIHMHDLVNPPSFKKLPWVYRRIYSRNTNAKQLLERILERLQCAGYDFRQIDDLYKALQNGNSYSR